MKIQIEAMRRHHIEHIHRIEEQSFTTPWRYSFFVSELENPNGINLVAHFGGIVAGYLCCRHIVNEGHIGNIAVAEDFRQHGIATALLESLFTIAKLRGMIGLTLEVATGNISAQNLYTKHGFAAEGLRKNYYADTNEDAIIMWKYLDFDNEYGGGQHEET